jgi:sugar phosphate isomerase/epimerase
MVYSRREFGRIAAALCAAKTALAAKIDSKFGGVQLGVQSYSFRDLSLDAAIAAMKNIGIGECELYMGHVEPAGLKGEQLKKWRLTTPLGYFEEIRRKFDNAGIELYAYSLNFNDRFSDQELDRGFQMTKALGTDIITTSTTLTCAERLVPFAEKYKVRVAMHGHDKTSDPNQFATPQSFARGLAMSKHFYINLDIGHFSAAGYDPVSYIKEQHSKILALHIKDRKKNHGPAVPFGEGDTPIKQVLLLLKSKRYPIPANIEYEYNEYRPGLDTVTEVRKCFRYCKDILV